MYERGCEQCKGWVYIFSSGGGLSSPLGSKPFIKLTLQPHPRRRQSSQDSFSRTREGCCVWLITLDIHLWTYRSHTRHSRCSNRQSPPVSRQLRSPVGWHRGLFSTWWTKQNGPHKFVVNSLFLSRREPIVRAFLASQIQGLHFDIGTFQTYGPLITNAEFQKFTFRLNVWLHWTSESFNPIHWDHCDFSLTIYICKRRFESVRKNAWIAMQRLLFCCMMYNFQLIVPQPDDKFILCACECRRGIFKFFSPFRPIWLEKHIRKKPSERERTFCSILLRMVFVVLGVSVVRLRYLDASILREEV